MPIPVQEIQHHRHRHNDRRADGQDNPQTSPPPRPPPHYPKANPESGTGKLLCLFFKCIVMFFILSLFLLFLGFAALVLLHFLLTSTAGRRRLRHLHQRRPDLLTNPTGAYSVEDLQGLLPHLIYDAAAQTAWDCAICLDSFKEGEACRKLPDCNHLFHVNCVDAWLTKVPNCPICRTRVRLDYGGSGSMTGDDEWKVWWPVGV